MRLGEMGLNSHQQFLLACERVLAGALGLEEHEAEDQLDWTISISLLIFD